MLLDISRTELGVAGINLPAATIKLIIADDQQAVRTGLARWFEQTEFEVVGTVASPTELLGAVDQLHPDVVLTESRLAQADVLVNLGPLRQAYPRMGVVVFSAYDNPSFVARALAGRVNAYLLKSASRHDLLSALRAAFEGRVLWSPEDQRRLQGALAVPRISGEVEVPLTCRENEVLGQVALGLTNKEIGRRLTISAETVKEHVQRILQKIGVRDRMQAALWVVRQGLA